MDIYGRYLQSIGSWNGRWGMEKIHSGLWSNMIHRFWTLCALEINHVHGCSIYCLLNRCAMVCTSNKDIRFISRCLKVFIEPPQGSGVRDSWNPRNKGAFRFLILSRSDAVTPRNYIQWMKTQLPGRSWHLSEASPRQQCWQRSIWLSPQALGGRTINIWPGSNGIQWIFLRGNL